MTHYTCPMHPEVSQDVPGICSKCGMALAPRNQQPVHDHTHHDHRALSPADSMSGLDRFRMSMTMTMGMDHTGLAGRKMAKLMEEDIRNKFFISLALTIPIVLYSPLGERLLGFQLGSPVPTPWLLLLLTTPVFFYCGWLFLYSAYWSLRRRALDMSVLIAVGISAAYLFSILLTVTGSADSFYEAAAMLITFVLFGHWMEMKSRRGTTDALQALFDLVPPQARVVRKGKEVVVSTTEIALGDTVVLKPGDKVPVDGQILTGETAIDESLVTGESLPVSKAIGDIVIGGSINQTGTVTFRATKVGQDTALAQIVKLVETAQNSKAPGQKLADRWAAYLVVLAVGSGLVTFLAWYLFGQASLLTALTFAISAVVIACPDALGLATPTAVAVGTGVGAKHNILIKDAPTLEQVSKIQAVMLDKTGTLTEGKPVVTEVIALGSTDEATILAYEAALETGSNHPLAMAIVAEATKRQVKPVGAVTKFESIAGHGLTAQVKGKAVLAGNEALMHKFQVPIDVAARTAIDRLAKAGNTLSLLAVDGALLGIVAAADVIKPTAKQAIAALHTLGIETAMISGDNQQTASSIAKQVGIDRVFAEVLPADKARYVQELQAEGKFVAMVGDGVNDAPALAQADIGIAIGTGTDVAIETAKVVLMRSDPADILRAITLSRATVRTMKQNLAWASIYNVLAIPVAAGVLYPAFGIALRPEVAALLMSISSIIVATNAVLLKRVERTLEEV